MLPMVRISKVKLFNWTMWLLTDLPDKELMLNSTLLTKANSEQATNMISLGTQFIVVKSMGE